MRLVLLSLLLLLQPVLADDAPVTAEARDKAIVAAMKHLDDSVWKMTAGGSPRREYTMAVTAWAYLLARDKAADGRRLPSRSREVGRLHDELVRYVERVEKLYENDDDGKRPPGEFERALTSQYVWPLSVIALYFSESAARGKSKGECRRMLKSIAGIFARAQQKDGGWGHDDAQRPGMGLPPIRIPKPGGGELDYPATLLCASHGALSALGAACGALKNKPGDVIGKARAYFAGAQNRDGSFPYDPSQAFQREGALPPVNATNVARTPGAVYALLLAGEAPDSEVIRNAVAVIDAAPQYMSEGHGSAALALQYGALLADARGDRAWRTFRGLFFARILAKQEESGAFLCAAEGKAPGVTVDTQPLPGMGEQLGGAWGEQNKTYVTSIHTLVLMLDRTDSKIAPQAPAPKGAVTPSEE